MGFVTAAESNGHEIVDGERENPLGFEADDRLLFWHLAEQGRRRRTHERVKRKRTNLATPIFQ